ncbi:flagellar basal body rod protein FlgB [Aquibacillus sediminis]|uniref:flagellar basal body rod protein FlgB n=1 Tax=Aquibacillus sediminis TaxID=2574734 RepID=UPI0011092B8D|nr:flagellar basal body rod protein FlgB [Aquibacillus sediminis]
MSFFGNTINTLQQSLDYASVKNQTISNNIANVDTPNYKAKNVTFKNVLDEKVANNFQAKVTHPKHIKFGDGDGEQPYQIISNPGTTYNNNGNNVDIDKEMSNLAKNQIYYQSLVDRMNGKFNSLQTVIKGGR